MGRRETTEARNQVLIALAELAEPSTVDTIAQHVTGTARWDTTADGPLIEHAIKALVRRGDVIVEWPRPGGWRVVYRLATDVDRAAAEDELEVERMRSGWEPAT